MVSKLLNGKNECVSDKDTKLDVLAILSNVTLDPEGGGLKAKEAVKQVLGTASEWFDDYMSTSERSCSRSNSQLDNSLEENTDPAEPELHKSMLLLLSRSFDYCLKTEDVLELCRADRSLAVETVAGVLEDGESYATELVQHTRPEQGQVGQVSFFFFFFFFFFSFFKFFF